MAAIHAAAGSRPVVLLERTTDGGRKILISGGGRCNVLPSRLSPEQFVTASSPNSLRKMLLSWPLPEQRAFFEQRMGLPLELEPETGKLFPATHRARDVRDGLVRLAEEAGVETRFGALVADLLRVDGGRARAEPPEGSRADDARWIVRCEGTGDLRARSVILACGGLSVPQTGSDGIGLRIARGLGHAVRDTYPALTPLTAEPPRHAHLAGLSLPVTLSAPGPRGSFVTRGGFLFTHRGYSGPSVLDISHVAVRQKQRTVHDSVDGRDASDPSVTTPILVQWTEHDAAALERMLTQPGADAAGAFVRRLLPHRLADMLLGEAGLAPATPLAQVRRVQRETLVKVLASYPLPWSGDEGYKKAEVTGGGVALEELHSRTLESRRHAGLHLCGEMLDAFGPIGGYNFAWAFATGRLAGLGAAA
jgi:predicted Rossmann fold flavoprotein